MSQPRSRHGAGGARRRRPGGLPPSAPDPVRVGSDWESWSVSGVWIMQRDIMLAPLHVGWGVM